MNASAFPLATPEPVRDRTALASGPSAATPSGREPDARAVARDARRQAIVEIARDSFLTDGFAGTSMSAIAARLGGSKGTLYNYFRSKEELFAAVMGEECAAEATAMTSLPTEGEIEDVLREVGRRFVRFIVSDLAIRLHRIVAAEGSRFPELGRTFYDNGPTRTLAIVSRFLEERMDEGRLRRVDPQQAAAHLMALLKATIHQAHLWGVAEPLTEAAVDAHVARCVDAFLRGYGVG